MLAGAEQYIGNFRTNGCSKKIGARAIIVTLSDAAKRPRVDRQHGRMDKD
jgi:hypothetical protein